MLGLALQLLLAGVAIAANNLAVAFDLGTMAERKVWPRILFVFGVFEFSVPLIGVWLGQRMSVVTSAHAGWLGPAMLAGLGTITVVVALRKASDRRRLARSLTGWRGLITMSAGLSTDNLVVGFGMGLGGAPPLLLAGTILCCSLGFAYLGLLTGHAARHHHKVGAGVFSGLILVGLAVALWAGRV